MSEARQARRFYVSGQVQGVGYRYFAHHVAAEFRLAGYAKNLPDGRVEIYAVGTQGQLSNFAAELLRGPRHAIVKNLDVENAKLIPEFSLDFTIA